MTDEHLGEVWKGRRVKVTLGLSARSAPPASIHARPEARHRRPRAAWRRAASSHWASPFFDTYARNDAAAHEISMRLTIDQRLSARWCRGASGG